MGEQPHRFMWEMWVRFLQDTLPQRCGKAIAFGFSFIIKYFFPTTRQPAAGAFGLVRFQAPVLFSRKGDAMKPAKLSFINGRPTIVDYDTRVRHDNDQAYNYHRRVADDEYVGFYKSKEWRTLRKQILERDLGLCQRCGMPAELVDHIIPSKDDWDDRLNPDNLQSLCRECHRIKTKREWMKHHKGSERYMEVNMVCGLPASGKTTYVKQHMTEHDLIYDYDELMQALTGLPSRSRNHDVHDYIMLFLDQMLRKLKAEQTFNNVWIIRTLPDERIDGLLANYHHVNHILIDTDPKVCLQRLKQRKQTIAFTEILNSFEKADFEHFRRVKNR